MPASVVSAASLHWSRENMQPCLVVRAAAAPEASRRERAAQHTTAGAQLPAADVHAFYFQSLVNWTPEADRDLRLIAAYTTRQVSPRCRHHRCRHEPPTRSPFQLPSFASSCRSAILQTEKHQATENCLHIIIMYILNLGIEIGRIEIGRGRPNQGRWGGRKSSGATQTTGTSQLSRGVHRSGSSS